ncbi:TetR family transcriptional regulator [Mycolicibacter minnesotensis]|uniref:TetR family transcriptional regulator n=1 Tax=Mycolicibacter minnesotensis TaxID=1118379 RepID=A0A7I7R782_9MYCO|nr:TetR/AcrR family transcriptional regulator C-terminal domain-containing protein [Mycolicibacter minnesotensis]ORB00775.1 TetR family transcriptional regulator [Mycolicibacter minnesotensis]BBY34524.1 hypothetical protein MMIN_25850 [Mycolicibacter minnesotensis]
MRVDRGASRRGRPRRIGTEAITRAVLEIGPQDATIRRVAEHLGVSLPGLYHHVKNQDDLLKLVASQSLQSASPPRFDGNKDWAQWLRQYAMFLRSALAAEPALLEKFISGAAEYDGELDYVGHALDALRAQGLSARDCLDVYSAVTDLAMGAVSEAHREYVHARQGNPWRARLYAALERSDAGEHATLRTIAEAGLDPFTAEAFERRVELLIEGIAARYRLPAPASGASPSEAER